MPDTLQLITPDWPAPKGVRAASTTRVGGSSNGDYAGFNLGDHVGDDATVVERNRQQLQSELGLNHPLAWLSQVHSAEIVHADSVGRTGFATEADAAWTRTPGVACVVMTADCLPVLFCDRNARMVAVAHAGWRGLANGILQNTVELFTDAGIATNDVLVWFGPAIGPQNYEVDEPVRDAFFLKDPECDFAFAPTREGHWKFDIYRMARRFLWSRGVELISGGEHCTYADERFFSFRRQGPCGRQASIVWLEP